MGPYHTSWAAEGGRNNGGKKQSGQSQIAFCYHRGILSQWDSLFFTFPSAHFSIKNALFLKFPAPGRTTLDWKTKRWNLASFPCCRIFNLPNRHFHGHPHCCYHEVPPPAAFHFSFRISGYFSWSLVTPWVTWKASTVELWPNFPLQSSSWVRLFQGQSQLTWLLSSAVESSQRFQLSPLQLSAGIFLVAGWD